jgi:RNA polymerase sigma-70 factor (ECF subfamily)
MIGSEPGAMIVAIEVGADRAREPSARAAPAQRDDRGLIEAAQEGSEQALEELFRRYWPRAHRAAYLVVHDAAAAEDIAQEAFLAAVRTLDRFDRRRPFGPWLHRIVVNRGIDWARARRLRRETGLGPPADVADPAPALGIRVDAGLGDSQELVAALRRLSPERRAVVVLRYLLDYTPGEIARMLDLRRGTVNSRLRRGLDALAADLGEAQER